MRTALHSRIVAALVAPAVFASVASQGLLALRCGETMRMSCCCPKEAPPDVPTLSGAALKCCSVSKAPAAQAQATNDRAPAGAPQPVLVAVGTPVAAPAVLRTEAPRLDPPPGRSPILTTCALLI